MDKYRSLVDERGYIIAKESRQRTEATNEDIQKEIDETNEEYNPMKRKGEDSSNEKESQQRTEVTNKEIQNKTEENDRGTSPEKDVREQRSN